MREFFTGTRPSDLDLGEFPSKKTRFHELLSAYPGISVCNARGGLTVNCRNPQLNKDIDIRVKYKKGRFGRNVPYLHLDVSPPPDEEHLLEVEAGSIDIGKDRRGKITSDLLPGTDLDSIFTATRQGLEIAVAYYQGRHYLSILRGPRVYLDSTNIRGAISYYRQMLRFLKRR